MKSRNEIQKQSLADFPGTYVLKFLFDNVTGPKAPTLVLFCKICEIFKNTFFYRTPPVATCGNNIKKQYVILIKIRYKQQK